MNKTIVLIFKVLLISACLLMAAFLAWHFYGHRFVPVKRKSIVEVLIAKKPIEVGEVIDLADIDIKKMPEKYVHTQAISSKMKEFVIGKVSIHSIKGGDPLLWDYIVSDHSRNLSEALGVSERAVTIRVDAMNSFQGMIEPGDRIDLMALVQPNDPSEEPVLKVIAQNIVVLAVDGRSIRTTSLPIKAIVPNHQGEPSTIQPVGLLTLKVSPGDAAVIAYAQTQGRLVLSLRNPNDVFLTQVPPVNAQSLLEGLSDAPEMIKKQQPVNMIEEKNYHTDDSHLDSKTLAAEHSLESENLK